MYISIIITYILNLVNILVQIKKKYFFKIYGWIIIIILYFVKITRLSPPWVSSKTIKTNNFFFRKLQK